MAAEKNEIIRRLNEVDDLSVIDAVKDLLNFAQNLNDTQLEKELEIGIKQLDNGEARPHDIVWAEIRNIYKQ